ncbi:MAG: ThiF family adenylyltransferase [Clostridia bacterium]|nr:ThiF family adenylyltransferase [Clostridia bacterium]
MEARYTRNVPSLSEAECLLLREKKAAVIGCGGLGGHLLELLARVGVGQLVAVDGDVFDETNLNRQLLSELPLLGANKARAAKARLERVNPDVTVTAVPDFLTAESAETVLSGCDVVLDALDGVEARKLLAKTCTALQIPLIHGAVHGWVAQAAVVLPGDGLLDRLYPMQTAARDKSVLSFTPALCASVQASLAVKLLTGKPVEAGKLYYFDLLHQEFETIPVRL